MWRAALKWSFWAILTCIYFASTFANLTYAQQTAVAISLAADTPARALIEITDTPNRTWSFRNEYAGVSELGARIENFKAHAATGLEVPTRKLAPGQFTAAADATRVTYEVDLTAPTQGDDAARVSWVSGNHGLLMLADLLPISGMAEPRTYDKRDRQDPLILQVHLPNGWKAYSSESEGAATTFTVADTGTTVLAVGNALRLVYASNSRTKFTLLTDGDWPFTDAEALKLATDILKTHRDVLHSTPTPRAMLTILPFPAGRPAEKWSAETRGASVTMLLGNQSTKNAALAQLGAALTHELFHLWVPNGLALSGDYDWFYEGFTVYQSSRTDVRLGFLTFRDFLNAIARAYDGYRATAERDQWSLVEASRQRWTAGQLAVYAKSMLVAFLYDLNLRKASHGKYSLDDIYKSMVSQFGAHKELTAPPDGSRAVINALNERLSGFADLYVEHPTAIDLSSLLREFGLRVETLGSRTQISVSDSLTHQQSDLLRNMGYNDRGRSTRRK